MYPVAALKPVKPFMSRLKKYKKPDLRSGSRKRLRLTSSKSENYFTTRRKDGASRRGVGQESREHAGW